MSVHCIAVDLYSGDRVDDFAAAKAAGVELVILKATEGASWRDHTYPARRDAARAAGLLVAAYHFSDTDPIQAQVANFLGYVLPDADPGLRFVLDWEKNDRTGAFMPSGDAKAWLAAVDAQTGRRTVVYASAGFLLDRLGAARDAEFGSHPLWIAAYRDSVLPPVPQASWASSVLWQYTDRGAVGGIPGNSFGQVDLNAAPGMTSAAFRAAWLGDHAAPEHPHDAAWVQARLNALGNEPPLDTDGDLGPKSVAAIAAFIEKYAPQPGVQP